MTFNKNARQYRNQHTDTKHTSEVSNPQPFR